MLGKFIVLEGLEGAGKSSAIQTVVNTLKQHHISDIVYTREPGGTPIAESLRDLIKTEIKDDPLTDKAELLMFYAARIQLVDNVIRPALNKGKWVIGDRHDLSTQAYQGGGRQIDPTFLSLLKNEVLSGFEPDLTLYLDISPEKGLERAKGRGALDRIEQESLEFFNRTRAYFLRAAHDNLTKIKVINAELAFDDVQQSIKQTISSWLAEYDN